MPGGAWTGDDREHNDACHERWLRAQNRRTHQPDYRDDWFDEQCGGCRFWVALSGELGRDWGVCTRPGSTFDGRARFEHDGCELFAIREDGSFG
ncbi:DUF3027 domain-containing protein [Streptomyces sp. NBC_00554]|uniref:DUF3027 domain-containing protein n=1 Tax=unclassified Streptomyces TaxID=2593676 RepID=UPI00224D4B17|nr:DUF3027 domain-containing protein [Streptomyces sp. NBC_00620]MCX4973710.1 DUF3027 domain-containing protein [Streptomyces sp. NBC_00620]WUC51545.1 DUF3027 domain-containing protein [Streptomyces sp. NBC_00554]